MVNPLKSGVVTILFSIEWVPTLGKGCGLLVVSCLVDAAVSVCLK